jgi:hypothetical protein
VIFLDKVSPNQLFELYKQNKINKIELIKNLLIICEYSESELLRKECLEIVSKIENNNERLFKILEDFAISESNDDVRLMAIVLIIKNFPKKGITIIEYLIKNSKSIVFTTKLIKRVGNELYYFNKEVSENILRLIKPILIEIFENEDIINFRAITGSWLYNTPKDAWDFVIKLKNSTSILEILDGIINDEATYDWFFEFIIKTIDFKSWILFFDNIKFSGRLLGILMYLEEEKPIPLRFYQFIEFFENLGKNNIMDARDTIINILKKENPYDLSVFVIFRWLEYLSINRLVELLDLSQFNLVKKIRFLFEDERFGFLEHPAFIDSLIFFFVKIHREVDSKYIIRFLFEMDAKKQENILKCLFKILKSRSKSKNTTEIKYRKKLRENACYLLKFLSYQYNFSKFDFYI